jgi:hypothetical protein
MKSSAIALSTHYLDSSAQSTASLIHRADVAAVDARVKTRERNHLQPDLEFETGWK